MAEPFVPIRLGGPALANAALAVAGALAQVCIPVSFPLPLQAPARRAVSKSPRSPMVNRTLLGAAPLAQRRKTILWPGSWRTDDRFRLALGSLRLCLGLFVLFEMTLPAAGSEARPAAEAYRGFLEETPWIKRILYRRSHSYEEGYAADTPAHPLERLPRLFVLDEFEAAWQPAGWYRRSLYDAMIYAKYSRTRGRILTNVPPPGQEFVIGTNEEYYWRISPGHRAVSIQPRPGGPGYSFGPDLVHANVEWRLRRTLRLGLDFMGIGPLRWLDPENFEVEPEHFYGFPNSGGRGRVVRRDETGRPLEVLYTIHDAPAGFEQIRVTYRYRPEQPFPPHEILVYQPVPGEGIVIHTNYIDHLELGLDPEAERGYYPEKFRAAHIPLARLIVHSNDIVYQVRGDGQLQRLPEIPYEPLPRAPSQWLLRTILMLLTGLSLALGAWMYWRYKRAARPPDPAQPDS